MPRAAVTRWANSPKVTPRSRVARRWRRASWLRHVLSALAARATCGLVRGEFESILAEFGTRAAQPRPEQRWAAGPLRAAGAAVMAFTGHPDAAIALLATVIPALERAEGSFANYTAMACSAADTLWAADAPTTSKSSSATCGRRSWSRTSATLGGWPAQPRRALRPLRPLRRGERVVRPRAGRPRGAGRAPLRAVADYDEALMYARRAADGDRERALPLLDAALAQFREIGMTGWLRRGEELREQVSDA